MTGEPDQISLMLGDMRAQLRDTAEDRKEMKAAISEIAASLQQLVIATRDLPKLTETVARHERLHQRGIGIVVAISMFVSLFGAGAASWLNDHFKW